MEKKGKLRMATPALKDSDRELPLRPFLPLETSPIGPGRLAIGHARHSFAATFGTTDIPSIAVGSVAIAAQGRTTSQYKPLLSERWWNYSRLAKTRQAGQGPPSVRFARFISLLPFQLITPSRLRCFDPHNWARRRKGQKRPRLSGLRDACPIRD